MCLGLGNCLPAISPHPTSCTPPSLEKTSRQLAHAMLEQWVAIHWSNTSGWCTGKVVQILRTSDRPVNQKNIIHLLDNSWTNHEVMPNFCVHFREGDTQNVCLSPLQLPQHVSCSHTRTRHIYEARYTSRARSLGPVSRQNPVLVSLSFAYFCMQGGIIQRTPVGIFSGQPQWGV